MDLNAQTLVFAFHTLPAVPLSRNTSGSWAWQRLWTNPKQTSPTFLGKRTSTCPACSMPLPWSGTLKGMKLTPASSARTSWKTPNSSTPTTPSSSWWRTRRPTPSCSLAGWSGQRVKRWEMSCDHVLTVVFTDLTCDCVRECRLSTAICLEKRGMNYRFDICINAFLCPNGIPQSEQSSVLTWRIFLTICTFVMYWHITLWTEDLR